MRIDYKIDKEYGLKFYACDQGIHTMVYKEGEPYVCRKTNCRQISQFLEKKEKHLFRGGLQFEWSSRGIKIIAKKTAIGTIPKSTFVEALGKIKAKKLLYYESEK